MRKPRLLSLEDATAGLERAESVLAHWSRQAADGEQAANLLAAELAEAESRAADDVLDDEDPEALSRVAGNLERLRTEQAVAAGAAGKAAERVVDARRDLLAARSGALRTRAAGLVEAATARQARTDQMLAELAEFERVPYAVANANRSGIGMPIHPRSLTAQIAERAQWLSNHADHLEFVASSGEPHQVNVEASKPMPEVLEVESAATASVGA